MTIRIVLVLVTLTLVLSHGYTQPPQGLPRIPPQELPLQSTQTLQPAKEKSLDQMLDELEALRVQKAEIEKKEQELIKVIQQKSAKQADRMKQLGLDDRFISLPPLA